MLFPNWNHRCSITAENSGTFAQAISQDNMVQGAKLAGVGHILRRLREDAGIGLNVMANRVKIRPGTLSKYETGALSIPVAAIVNIAKTAGLDPEKIVIECLFVCHPMLLTSEFGEKLKQFVDEKI